MVLTRLGVPEPLPKQPFAVSTAPLKQLVEGQVLGGALCAGQEKYPEKESGNAHIAHSIPSTQTRRRAVVAAQGWKGETSKSVRINQGRVFERDIPSESRILPATPLTEARS